MTPDDGSRTRIRAPIFLNCLSRGGSNIFWNLFLTHPDVCSPILETVAIFRADWRAPTRAGLWLALLSGQPRFFDQWHLEPRRSLRPAAARFLDRTLHRRKLLTLTDPEMRYKNRTETYTAPEVERARLVAKNNNGLVFAAEILREIYPDATFFGLTRHPLALYESHKRRRITPSPESFAEFYATIVARMLADADRFERCFLVRFEDVLADPIATLRGLYRDADLDFEKIRELRFRSKDHYQKDGSRGTKWELHRHHWFEIDAVHRFLDSDINQLHFEKLDPRERDVVLERTAAVRERLSYTV